jgi:predicted NACHT family NTPase
MSELNLDELREENKRLRSLLVHCWIHSGYPDCGYLHMSTEEKALYDEVVRDGRPGVLTD